MLVLAAVIALTTVPTMSGAPARPAGTSHTHVVRSGETVGAIALRERTTVAAIVAANHLSRGGSFVRVGQVLTIPHPCAPATPRASTPTSPSPTQARALVSSTARRHGIDPRLALAIAYQESGFSQGARSRAGAVGIMQVMPANTRWLSQLAGRRLDLTRAEDNVTAGVLLLRHLVRYAPTLPHAIGGYYQGLPSILARGPYRDTSRYVANVLALMRRF